MAILNYTTKISPMKSASEIQGILASKGAKSINIDFQNGEPVALYFKIEVHSVDVSFRLPSNWQGVYDVLRRDPKVPGSLTTHEQAKRVGWRIVKRSIIQSRMATILTAGLPASNVAWICMAINVLLIQRQLTTPGASSNTCKSPALC